MAQRRYGPSQGAGVVIVERESQKTITPGALGVVGYAGFLERGPTDKLIGCTSKLDALRQTGGLISEGYLPDALRHFWDNSAGAGLMFLRRIVKDGRKSNLRTYSRDAPVRASSLDMDAENPGRWAGKRKLLSFTVAGGGSIGATTLTTTLNLKKDEVKGGTLFPEGLPAKSYEITGNTEGPATVITIAANYNLSADWTAGGGGDLDFFVELENGARSLAVYYKDGVLNPTTEFGVEVWLVDDTGEVKVLDYPDCSMDPNSVRYVVPTINDDPANIYIRVTNLTTGTVTASLRPANHYGQIPTGGITATTLKIEASDIFYGATNTGVGVPTSFTPGSDARSETLTLTCTIGGAGATFTVDSDLQDKAFPNLTTAVAYAALNKYTTGFTLPNGSPAWVAGDTVTIRFQYLRPNEAKGGFVFPDYVNFRTEKFEVVSNTVDTVTVKTGSDMTVNAVVGDTYRLEYKQQLANGYDGIANVLSADLEAVWDTSLSYFNQLAGQNLGLVKLAHPGETTTAVQKALIAYADAKNYVCHPDLPSNITTELAAVAHVETTIGRSDFAVWHMPGWVYETHPTAAGLKLVPATGMIHGREARTAVDFQGYHKAATDIQHVLSQVRKLPTGDSVLNEEVLNPKGINVIKKSKGNFILWGDRIAYLDPAWKFKHQREQMSHYEHVLQENFDFIVFAINDALTRDVARSALVAYFLPEFTKRALRGDSFEDAASIKIDAENNPEIEVQAGNMNADIKLRLADTVERFIISIGKAGIFDDLSA